MTDRLFRPVLAIAVLCAAGLLAPSAMATEPAPPAQDDIQLSDILTPSLPDTALDQGFLPTQQLIEMTTQVPLSYYIGIRASVVALDGGPNVDKNDYLSNAYSDAFSRIGVQGAAYLDIRALPNVYLRLEMGTVLFTGSDAITDNMDRSYELDSMTIIFGSIGGAFYYPVLLFSDDPEAASDIEGVQIFMRFAAGLRYMLDTDAQTVSDPTGGLFPGQKFEFFHPSGGFTFTVGAGVEYRVKLFTAFAEVAVSWWEGPSPGTHPRDFSNGEVLVGYPLSVGFAMRF